MEPQPRLFTHDEATARLPWLRSCISLLQQLKRERDTTLRRFADLTPAMRSNGSAIEGSQLETRIDELVTEMRSVIEEITSAGIEVKDIDNGLVDFPSLRGDRIIYLCWLMSEPEISFWHELDAGFAGRQPIEQDG